MYDLQLFLFIYQTNFLEITQEIFSVSIRNGPHRLTKLFTDSGFKLDILMKGFFKMSGKELFRLVRQMPVAFITCGRQ